MHRCFMLKLHKGQLTMNLPTITLLFSAWLLIHFGALVNGEMATSDFTSCGGLVEGGMFTFHIRNKCTFTVWPAAAPNAGHPVIANGGFALEPGLSKMFHAPRTWNGRFWARTGCKFNSTSTNDDAPACETGDCEGGLACNGTIGLPPATLVEVALQEKEPSYYDVSLVDGYNIPISVSSRPADATCSIAGCSKSVNSVCPKELQVLDKDGKTVACKSACLAYNTDSYCCRNDHSTPETCKANSYSKMFKEACPSYYSHPFDSPTPLKNCCTCEFVITFCPSKWSDSSPESKAVWSY